VSCLLLCYPLGIVYRSFLDPSLVSSSVRQAVGLTWGIIFGWISFRWLVECTLAKVWINTWDYEC
jgi:hypothetical protein